MKYYILYTFFYFSLAHFHPEYQLPIDIERMRRIRTLRTEGYRKITNDQALLWRKPTILQDLAKMSIHDVETGEAITAWYIRNKNPQWSELTSTDIKILIHDKKILEGKIDAVGTIEIINAFLLTADGVFFAFYIDETHQEVTVFVISEVQKNLKITKIKKKEVSLVRRLIERVLKILSLKP